MVTLLVACQESSPDLKVVLALRNAMAAANDLRQPMNLGQQLLSNSRLSKEVSQAMIEMLQVSLLPCPWVAMDGRPQGGWGVGPGSLNAVERPS